MKRTSIFVALLLTAITCVAASPRDKVIDYLALYYAAQAGDELLVEGLLNRGAPVDAPGVDSAGKLSFQAANFNSPLQAAAANGNVKIVRLLLERKPWVDHRCCTSPAALGMATEAGHTEIVEMLLKAGADPSIKSEYDDPTKPETPLQVAQKKKYTAIVHLLQSATHPPASRP